MVNAVEYLGIDDAGLHIRVAEGEPQVLPVDTVIVCAGQDPLRELQDGLLAAGQSVHLIGGADVAAELMPSAPSTRVRAWLPNSESLSAICCVAEKLR